MYSETPIPSPSLADEQERLRKWREVRRRSAVDPDTQRLRQADDDRKTRLDRFEADKADRIRTAETRRREDAEAIEARRMDKARAHLEALDDIESACAALMTARSKSRRLTFTLLAAFVGLPTILTAGFYLFIAPPIFQSTSVLAVSNAAPTTANNPLFNDFTAEQATMSAAFQLRAQMRAQAGIPFEMAISTSQGLLSLTTFSQSATSAYSQNALLITKADQLAFPARLKVLSQPKTPAHAISRAPRNTLLAFLVSLSLFTIIAVFFQSFRHYARF